MTPTFVASGAVSVLRLTRPRAGLGVCLLVLGLAVAGCTKKKTAPGPQAVPVEVITVQSQDTPIYVENIGQTLGAQDVEIRARVEGFLETVDFVEGAYVEAGTLLYTIDDRPFKASLAQAEAVQAQAQSAADKARRDVERYKPLIEKNAISRQQFDDALAAERAAGAQLLAASAQVETARIQLGYTRISTPIAGIVGKTEVKAGNLVGRGQTTLLTTVSTIDPIHLRFSISEKDYLAWQRVRTQQESRGALLRDVFELILADGTEHKYRGHVSFADRQIDPTTGTLLLEVTFPNPERIVRPGQFGRVRFPAEVLKDTIVIPQRAVREMQATYSVFVVTAENKAGFRKVEIGPRVGSSFVVLSGLKPGERVVVEGVQKLQNGVPVIVKPAAAPAAAPAPAPTATAPAHTP